ncbi:MAG TPA: dienelactone hydrolase family protein [Candidatus Limnocylindria bacterium]|nr:dienelactone hydrolase family protein [Candidatus Limnocylindria bacterium]
MPGQTVSYKANGGTAEGYLATAASGKGPGVIVIQEWWGLNDQIKGVADTFAREGFVALAPDFYHGTGAKIGEPNEAEKLMMDLFQAGTAAKDARGAAQYLAKHPAVTSKKIGVIGFCMGGGLALLTAAEAPNEIGAVVDCYGVGQDLEGRARRIKAPVLGIFGAKDHAMPAPLQDVEKGLKASGAPFTKQVYPQADHAFLNEQRKDAYRPDDAKDAWSRIMRFLRASLA